MPGESAQREFDWKARRSIQERFEAFHATHPEIYTYLIALVYELRRRGYEQYGIAPLWERMRWHFKFEKDLGEGFKLPNDYRSRYARLIMKDHPELDGFFKIRKLRSK